VFVCVCLQTDENARALGQTSSQIAAGLQWKPSATNAVPKSEVKLSQFDSHQRVHVNHFTCTICHSTFTWQQCKHKETCEGRRREEEEEFLRE
jgi:hypothetical protein